MENCLQCGPLSIHVFLCKSVKMYNVLFERNIHLVDTCVIKYANYNTSNTCDSITEGF
jgi:hypothetical protein